MGLALKYLPSTTVSLLTNLTSPIILVFSLVWLKEIPGPKQYLGLALAFGGMLLFFYPFKILFSNPGLLILSVGLFGFAFYSLLGRFVARTRQVPYLVQTSIPFLVGGGILMIIALRVEGVPVITGRGILILAWMVVFNSIIGYVLYNQALRQLSAVEIDIMLKLTPFFTAISAWLILGESVSGLQLVAMVVVLAGTLLVQMKPKPDTP
jgi:drug/metabolite transporter (DMT)-like permease